MKYQQPYGVSDPNAGYVNGNPTTGTMGSIPPAASIEYDMREIVEVIGRAQSRGYIDFADQACAAPADADLQQLRKAIEGFVRARPSDFIDLIDTFVTFTVHGTTPDFADLNTAMHYLSKYKITTHGRVVLQLRGTVGAGAATQYVYNTDVTFEHPNNNRIFVLGATLRSPIPTSRSGYTLTGSSSGARASDTAANLAQLRTRFATELRFTGAHGIKIEGQCLGGFDALLITGDGSAMEGILVSASNVEIYPQDKIGAPITAFPLQQGVAITGFGRTGLYVGQSGNATAYMFGYPLVVFGNASNGINIACHSAFQPGLQVLTYSNGNSGLEAQLGSVIYMDTPGCESAYNANQGVVCQNGSDAFLNGMTIWGNVGYGVYCSSNAHVDATNCLLSIGGVYNAAGDAYCAEQAIIKVTGVTGHRSLWSPALITDGNNKAWIHT